MVAKLLFSLIPNPNEVFTKSDASNDSEEINSAKVEQEIKKDFGIEVTEELDMNAVKTVDDKFIVNTDINTEDITVSTEVEYDTESGAITVEGIMKETDGTKKSQNLMSWFTK